MHLIEATGVGLFSHERIERVAIEYSFQKANNGRLETQHGRSMIDHCVRRSGETTAVSHAKKKLNVKKATRARSISIATRMPASSLEF